MKRESFTDKQNKIRAIAASAGEAISENIYYWPTILIGVLVTGTMTFSLAHKGMQSSALWANGAPLAAFCTTLLLEGSAVALTYGHQYWFRSEAQRSLAKVAGWVIWIILGLTAVAHFAANSAGSSAFDSLLSWHASYILPLAIVIMPMLAKRLYELRPDSQIRVAVLENEAKLMTELIAIEAEQNAALVADYRGSFNTETVKQARELSFQKLSLHNAREVAGYTDDIEWPDELDPDPKTPRP